MDYREDSHTENKEKNINMHETIYNTSASLMEDLDMDKEKILKQLESAKNAEERVKLFAKWADTFGLEALVGLFEAIGDFTPAIACTCYLLAEGIHIGLSWKDCLKILGYQTADALIGIVPGIGDIADFFFLSNRYSSKVFSAHLDKLKQAALEKGISQEEIDAICKKEARYINTMDRYVNYRSQHKDKIKKKLKRKVKK